MRGMIINRHHALVELVTDEACSHGLRTLRRLSTGLAAVLERLEYGAAKHPDEPWRGLTDRKHIVALLGHAEALAERDYDLPVPERRKHLAAVACRALFALTVEPYSDNEMQRIFDGMRRRVAATTPVDAKEEPSSQPSNPKGESIP